MICNACHEDLPESDFYRRRPDGTMRRICKECECARNRLRLERRENARISKLLAWPVPEGLA